VKPWSEAAAVCFPKAAAQAFKRSPIRRAWHQSPSAYLSHVGRIRDKLHGGNNAALTFWRACVFVRKPNPAAGAGIGALQKLLSRVCHRPAAISLDSLAPLRRWRSDKVAQSTISF
jgi:hypothetical protein